MAIESMTVSFLGDDERSKSMYQFFFETIKWIQCEFIDDHTKAQLCLVDKDSYNIQHQYEKLIQNYPNKYILVLSIKEHSCSHNNEFYLKKPFKRDALQESLNQILRLISGKHTSAPDQAIPLQKKIGVTTSEKTSQTVEKDTANNSYVKTVVRHEEPVKPVEKTKDNTIVPIKATPKVATANAGKLLKVEHEELFVGEQSDIDIKHPEQLKKIFYKPNESLQACATIACKKSQQSEQIIQLKVLNNFFYFDYQERKVYSNVGQGAIRPLCLIPHNHIFYSVIDNSFRDELHDISQANKNKTPIKQSWDMESFMWLIALWSSRGRVPQGTDLKQPVYLMQWPNLTRLAAIPHAVRIAALLYSRPTTLIEAAKQLGIKQRYVFAFYSACRTIGLSNITRRQADKLFVAEKPEQHKHQSILSKILGKLFNMPDKSSMNVAA